MAFDERSARCTVLTYREGALSALGHDLKLEVSRFSVDVDAAAGTVRGAFDARSLRVACAIVDGEERLDEPNDADRRKVEESIVRDVLQADRFPTITFESTAVRRTPDGHAVEGHLSLHGVEKAIAFVARSQDGRSVARIRLQQPDFAVRPFSAMLGVLRVKRYVDVEIDIPLV